MPILRTFESVKLLLEDIFTSALALEIQSAAASAGVLWVFTGGSLDSDCRCLGEDGFAWVETRRRKRETALHYDGDKLFVYWPNTKDRSGRQETEIKTGERYL